MSPLFDLSITATTGNEHKAFLRHHLLKAHALCRSGLAELSVALVGDAIMSRLHERHMAVAGSTDVLSFELEHDRRGRVRAGEVIVCVPEARRQAKARKIPLRNELLLYAVHGMLHLSGYDDIDDKSYRRMHRMEDQILTRLGIGEVFTREAGKRNPHPNPLPRGEGVRRRRIRGGGACC